MRGAIFRSHDNNKGQRGYSISETAKTTLVRLFDQEQLQYSFIMASEVIWTYGWMLAVFRAFSPDLTYPPLTMSASFVLALSTERIVRWCLQKRWSERWQRLILSPCFVAFLILLLWWNQKGHMTLSLYGWINNAISSPGPLALGSLYGLFLIWRALRIGRESFSYYNLLSRFFIGLTGIIILLLIWGLWGGPDHTVLPTLVASVIAYFGMGLISLALKNLGISRRSSLATRANVQWLTIITLIVVAVLACGLAVSAAFHQELAAVFLPILHIANKAITLAVSIILVPVAYVVEFLFNVIKYAFHLVSILLLSLVGGGQPEQGAAIFSPLPLENVTTSDIPPALFTVARWALSLLLAGGVIYFLARSISRLRQGQPLDDAEEVSESIWKPGALRAELKAMLLTIIGRWRWKRKDRSAHTPSDEFLFFPKELISDKVLTVREIYRMLLWCGQEIGLSRQSSETPYEYAQKLEPHEPAVAGELHTITEAFIGNYYGGFEMSDEKLLLLNGDLKRVLSALIAGK